MEAISAIGRTIEELSGISTAVAGAVEQQDAATREIARNIQQAATGTEEVTSNTAEVTTSVSQTGETANIVLGIADELAEQSNQLRDQVSSFLTSIRAA